MDSVKFISGPQSDFRRQLNELLEAGYLVQHFSSAGHAGNGVIYSAIMIHKGLIRKSA